MSQSNFHNDFIGVTFSKLIIIIFSLITASIVARELGVEKNGVLASLLVYPSLFVSVGSLGIRQAVMYYLGKKILSEIQLKKAISQIWFISSFLSLVVCYFLISEFTKFGTDRNLIFLAISPIPLSLFNTYNSGIFLGKNQISIFNKINWIPPFVVLLLTVILVYIFQAGISGYLIAKIGGPFVIFIVLLIRHKFFEFFSLNFDWKVMSKLLRLGLVYALALFVIGLNYKVDIILLGNLSTDFELGIYSKGVSITEYLWQIPMLLSTIVMAKSATSKNDRVFSLKVAQLLRISFVLIGAGSIILYLFSKQVIHLMFGSQFESSTYVLQILLPGVILLTIFKVINMDLSGKGKPWISIYAMLPSLILNITLNYILIPQLGAYGAALASTISYSVAAIVFLILYSIEVKVSLSEILKFKKSDFDPVKQLIQKIIKK